MQTMWLIKTPLTTDGLIPLMENSVQQFTQNEVTEAGKKEIERLNQRLPNHLKHIIVGPVGETVKEDNVVVSDSGENTIKKIKKNGQAA